MYPSGEKNIYPQKLCNYIYDRFFETKDKSPRILDIGCGKGTILKAFARNGMECYGIDLRDENNSEIIFKKCNIEQEQIPFGNDFFDAIFTKSVIEHVYNTDNFLSEVRRVLRPSGSFICMTPDWKSQMYTFYNDYTHVKPFTRKGLQDALLINGFEDVECEYFYQLPFVWKYPFLKFVPKIIAMLVPDFLKWKTRYERNTKDRKLIRFSKEIMLLACGRKKCQS